MLLDRGDSVTEADCDIFAVLDTTANEEEPIDTSIDVLAPLLDWPADGTNWVPSPTQLWHTMQNKKLW